LLLLACITDQQLCSTLLQVMTTWSHYYVHCVIVPLTPQPVSAHAGSIQEGGVRNLLALRKDGVRSGLGCHRAEWLEDC